MASKAQQISYDNSTANARALRNTVMHRRATVGQERTAASSLKEASASVLLRALRGISLMPLRGLISRVIAAHRAVDVPVVAPNVSAHAPRALSTQ